MASIDQVKRFAGIDPTSPDDPALTMCLAAAAGWYTGAGVPPRTGDELYDFWVCNLAAWMYDMRGGGDNNTQMPPYIVASVHQLRASAPSGTGSEGGSP